MICRVVLLSTLLSSQFVFALSCKISKQSSMEVSGENFTVASNDHSKITFIETDQISDAVTQQAQAILNLTLTPTPTLLLRIRFFLDQNKEFVSNGSTNVLYLQEALLSSLVDYVAIDMPSNNIAGLERLASRFDPSLMPQYPDVQLSADDVNKLVLLTVGPALYVKMREPELFKDITLEPLNIQRLENAPKKNSLKLDQLMEKFETNRRTSRQVQRVARDLKTGKYRGLSKEEIKERVLARFWRPAKKPVSDWLDSELGGEPRSPPPPQILSHKGAGLAFIPRGKFGELEKNIRRHCAQ